MNDLWYFCRDRVEKHGRNTARNNTKGRSGCKQFCCQGLSGLETKTLTTNSSGVEIATLDVNKSESGAV